MNPWICSASAKRRLLYLKHEISFSDVLCKPVILQLNEGLYISNTKHESWVLKNLAKFWNSPLIHMSQKGFLTKKVIFSNVAACVSWAEWFVSLSWSKNTDEVTIESVNLFYYGYYVTYAEVWNRRVLTNLTMKNIWSKCNREDFWQIWIEYLRFKSDFNCSCLHQLRGELCKPFHV